MTTISTFGTTKRKPLLDYNGHSYVKDRSTTEKIYWRCSRYSTQHCRSRLHTCIFTNNVVKPPTEHSCTFDGTTLELRKFDQQIIDRAKNKKKNQHFEMRLLNLISTPHADIITQIDSIAHNVTL